MKHVVTIIDVKAAGLGGKPHFHHVQTGCRSYIHLNKRIFRTHLVLVKKTFPLKLLIHGHTPVFSKKFPRPPGLEAATDSQTVKPTTVPPMAPDIMAGPVNRAHDIHRTMGTTAEPMRTPMNR